MSKHAAPRTRSTWTPLVVSVLAGTVLVGTGAGVFAALKAVSTATTGANTAQLSLVQSPTQGANGPSAGLTATLPAAAPGDSFLRFVDLTNNGTIDAVNLTVSATATAGAAGNALIGTAGTALQVTVETCTGTWSLPLSPASTCSGTRTTPLTSRTLGSLSASTVLAASLPAGAAQRLRVTFTVPDLPGEVTVNGTPSPAPGQTQTVQGKDATITWTFSADQRAAVTSSS